MELGQYCLSDAKVRPGKFRMYPFIKACLSVEIIGEKRAAWENLTISAVVGREMMELACRGGGGGVEIELTCC